MSGKPLWAQQIASLRKKLGISQAALAARLSTSQSNVGSWETGRYRPSPSQFIEIAKMLPVEIESLALMQEAGVSADFFSGSSPKGHIPIVVAESAVREAEQRRMAELAASGALKSMDDAVRHVPLLIDPNAAGVARALKDKDVRRLIPIPNDWLPVGGNLLAFTVECESMAPILLPGYTVIVDVDQCDPARLVDTMVAARDDGMKIKWLRQDATDYLLLPNHVSERHPARVLRRGISIIGKVVMWIGVPSPAPRER